MVYSMLGTSDPVALSHQQPVITLGLISDRHLRNLIEQLGSELFMPLDCDLAAVVYDPPAPGFPHMAALFERMPRLSRARPVKSMGAGEEALVNLVGELTNERATA